MAPRENEWLNLLLFPGKDMSIRYRGLPKQAKPSVWTLRYMSLNAGLALLRFRKNSFHGTLTLFETWWDIYIITKVTRINA